MADTKYLKKRGQTWSVIVAVPQQLQGAAGCHHFVKALNTRDLTEANRRKHYWIAEFKRRIEHLKRDAADPHQKVFKLALELREALESEHSSFTELPSGETVTGHDELLSLMLDEARDIAESNPELARRFKATALGKATFIRDLWPQWLAEIDCAEKTKAQHTAVIRDYVAWSGRIYGAGERITVEETDKRRAGAYVSHLHTTGRARTTIACRVSSLSSLWQWLEARGIVEGNPWRGLKLKAKTAYTRRALSNEELVQLLSASSSDSDRAPIQELLRLALLTGCRLEELCTLKRASVDRRDDGWWIAIEGGKTKAARREVPVHKIGSSIIERLTARNRSEYLFEHLRSGPYGRRSHYVSKVYGKFRKRAGVTGRGADFHALRNTFIAMMEGEGVTESTVKLLVGHKRSSMTFGHYSKGERVDLREAINRLRYGDDVMRLLGVSPP